jgi:hypothetical protein
MHLASPHTSNGKTVKKDTIKDSDPAKGLFHKLPTKTKEMLNPADREEHTFGAQKVVLQKKIRQIIGGRRDYGLNDSSPINPLTDTEAVRQADIEFDNLAAGTLTP